MRLRSRLLPLVAVLLAAAGCSDSALNSSATTAPAAATTADTFTGTLTLNGAFSYPFVVLAPGTISAAVNSLSPDSTQPIGLALGTWNGSICQVVLSNDTAIQGSTVVGQSTASGNFCARVYDAFGTVASPESFVIQVTHP